jgi:Fe2+ transport system protein B
MQHLPEPCEGCELNPNAHLKKLGVNTSGVDYVIALAGNPNVGKSTVFNALTGLKQHTGNWPGKTISRMEGGYAYKNNKYKIVDLPGTYSLLSASRDEEIARDFILFGQPDVTVIVADACRLERNLNLVLQILEITDKAVLCLNLLDEAKRHDIVIDQRALARELGIPVVGTIARFNKGIKELTDTIHQVATGEIKSKPYRVNHLPGNIRKTIDELAAKIEEEFDGVTNSRWLAIRLLEGDESIVKAIKNKQLPVNAPGNA